MAPGRLALGWLAGVAALLVVVVTGCGGGGSSTASGTTRTSSTTAPHAQASATHESKEKADATAPSAGAADEGQNVKKHPPLELPTGKPEKGFTKQQRERALTADIEVMLPGGLTSANTCSGKDISPKLSWRHVPPGVSELVIFAMNAAPVEGKLYFDWAMAGIDPTLNGLSAGEIPAGAVLGRNSAGQNRYSLCPEGSGSESFIFALYAVEGALSPKSGFDPLALRKQATSASEKMGLTASSLGG